MTYYSAKSLVQYPFIEISEVPNEGGPGTVIPTRPNLISRPSRVDFSQSMTHSAFVYDVRPGVTEGIGNPNESIPQGGIRVFSSDAKCLLMGGTSSERGVLYAASGPTYRRVDPSPMPLSPDYVTHAAITGGGELLFMVTSASATTIKVYEKDGDQYTFVTNLTSPVGSVESIRLSPTDDRIIVNGSADHAQFYTSSLAQVANTPSGVVIAISPGSAQYILDAGSGNLQAYRLLGDNTFESRGEVPSSTGTDRRAVITNDGLTLIVTGNLTDIGSSAAFYYYHDYGWYLTGSEETLSAPDEAVFGLTDDMDYGALYTDKNGAQNVARFIATTKELAPIGKADTQPQQPNDALASVVAYSPDGTHLIVATSSSYFLHHYTISNGTYTLVGTISNSPQDNVRDVKFSPDGNYLAVVSDDSTKLHVYKWNGTSFAKLASVPSSFLGSPLSVSWEPDSSGFAVAASGTTNVWYLSRSGDTFTLSYVNNPSAGNDGNAHVEILSDGQIMLVSAYNGSLSSFARTGGAGFTHDAQLLASGVSGFIVTPDAQFIIYAKSPAPYLGVMSRSGTTFSAMASAEPSTEDQPAGLPSHLAISNGGSRIVTSRFDERLAFFLWDGVQLTRSDGPAELPPSTPTALTFSPDDEHLTVAHGGTSLLTIYEGSEPFNAYTFVKLDDIAVTNTGSGDISMNGTNLHIGNLHLDVVTGVLIDPLPFEDTYSPTQVEEVQWSPTRKQVTFTTPEGFEIAMFMQSQGMVKASNLNGTFVSVYERQSDEFVEIDWMAHPGNVEISDLAFSATPHWFSYFARNQDASATNQEGRFFYGIDNSQIYEGGVDSDPAMLRSFVAFQPGEAYAVATYEMSNGQNQIRLYGLSGVGGFSITHHDTDLIGFGPCDFSNCGQVVVAHGGTPPAHAVRSRHHRPHPD